MADFTNKTYGYPNAIVRTPTWAEILAGPSLLDSTTIEFTMDDELKRNLATLREAAMEQLWKGAIPKYILQKPEFTELNWQTSDDPAAMLRHLGDRASERKLRLWVDACRVAAGYPKEYAVKTTVGYWSVTPHKHGGCSQADRAAFVREIFGNPFRPIKTTRIRSAALGAVGIECEHGYDVCPQCDAEPEPWFADVLAWRDGTIPKLAAAMHESGDYGGMEILHDALSESGCVDESILSHCRQVGGHVKGCWLLDLLLGKEQ